MINVSHETSPEFLFNYTAHMAKSDDAGKWKKEKDYAIWTGSVAKEENEFQLYEWINHKIAVITKDQAPLLHVIRAGVPFHINHLFGYWHVSDSDVVYIRFPKYDRVYYMLVIGGTKNLPDQNRVQWYCPQCLHLLKEIISLQLPRGFNDFIERTQIDAVRTFNASISDRTCLKCNTVHPEAYGFDYKLDTEIEREARLMW